MSRIAIVDRARLRVIDVGRRKAVDLSANADLRLANRQPAWSADGARLAWSAFDRRQPDSPASLVVATPEGTSRVDHDAVFPPFYLAWRPDGGAIAALSDGPLGLELTVTDVRSGNSEIVHRGAPLYFAWSRSGLLAIHSGVRADARLEVRGDGIDAAAWAEIRTGAFSAPAFAGDDLVAVVRPAGGDGPVLVRLRSTTAAIEQVIAPADFGARFTVDASGQWLAASSERGTPGALVVHHLGQESLTFVDDASPALFAWSPDAAQLLFARVIERGDFPKLQWCVWRDGEVTPVTEGRVSATFAREVLPFHEQFMRSHTWWAPDGSAFCLAALDDYGNDAVWIADVRTGRRERLSTGSLAVWSPH